LDFKAGLSHVVALLAATIDEEDAAALWRNLLSIQGAEATLTAALADAELPVPVARAGVRPVREAAPDSALVPRLLQLAGMSLSTKPPTGEEIAVLAQEAMTKGDPVRGERIFRRPELGCVSCHAIGGIGGHVGPDLTSIGGSAQPDYLLESLIYPNLRTKEGYVAVQMTTRDQQVLNGMIVREDAQELALRSVTNEVVSIPVANIAERRDIGSLMPAGLIDSLLPEERMDLVRFLAALGKMPDFNAARNNVARFWRTYRVDSVNQAVGVEGVVKGDFTLADWQPAPTFVNGWLAKEIVLGRGPARRGGSRGIFAAVRFTPHQPGPVAFALEGDPGNVWLNGEPIKAGAQFTAEARAGTNVLVFQLTTGSQPREIRLTSDQVSFLTE
jgi:putative heme-binding domain-containing protein